MLKTSALSGDLHVPAKNRNGMMCDTVMTIQRGLQQPPICNPPMEMQTSQVRNQFKQIRSNVSHFVQDTNFEKSQLNKNYETHQLNQLKFFLVQ